MPSRKDGQRRLRYDHAVLYRDMEHVTPTAAMEGIKRRLEETKRKRDALLDDSKAWAGRKSKYVTCEKCGSKLNIECLRSMHTYVCPLCRNDMRLATVLNRIKAYDENIKELRRKYNKEAKRKAPVKWLAKAEIHC